MKFSSGWVAHTGVIPNPLASLVQKKYVIDQLNWESLADARAERMDYSKCHEGIE